MSTAGMFLKKVTFIDPQKTLMELIDILDSLGFSYTVDSISSEPNGFQLGINDPKRSSDFCMYIFDKPKLEYMEDDDFSWISPGIYTAVLIEDLCDSEDSVLNILYRYLRVHPNEYFYAEDDWFYTLKDIERIYKSKEWYHWCYKRPS